MRSTVFAGALLAALGLLAWAAADAPKQTAAPAAPPAASTQALHTQLTRRVDFNGLDDPKTTLQEALQALAKWYFGGADVFDVNERAFNHEQLKDVLKAEVASPNPVPPMKNVRLVTVLRKILSRIPAPSGATFLLRPDVIEITTGEFERREVWGAADEGPFLPVVHLALDHRPLDEALRDLADQAAYNVVLDGSTAEKGKTALTAKMYNAPLDTAVRLLAGMAGLRLVQVDNVLYVTTKEGAEALEKDRPRKQARKGDWDWTLNGTTGLRLPTEKTDAPVNPLN
jgi:hypothetical protein